MTGFSPEEDEVDAERVFNFNEVKLIKMLRLLKDL